MRVLIVGNSGSGKSHRAKALAAQHGLAHLDLDTIVWEPGKIAVPRPAEQVQADLRAFASANASWVAEGCYGDLVEAALPYCSELVFMNPGCEACIANNRKRPWEPHKYASLEAQQSKLAFLLEWVALYYSRDDVCSYAYHRRVFDAFDGNKTEVVQLG
jgi:adenylate kinase family enzyme